MITVRMIKYWNDYHKKEVKEHFNGLKELEEWIFGQMCADYSSEHGSGLLFFPKCDVRERILEISVQPEHGSHVFWIKLIEDMDLGIVFSDGTFTAGQKYCTKMVREWLEGCEKRKNAPTFHFAPDGTEGDLKENIRQGRVDEMHIDRGDMVPGQVIRKAIKRIHEIGGCDAMDEYSEGYDDAIDAALNILLGETGYTVEDVTGYDEGGKE